MLRTAYLPFLFALLACSPSEGQAAGGENQGDTGEPPGDAIPSESLPSTPRSTSGQEALPPPGHAWVIFDTDTVVAEVARTPEERAQGLMYRENLAGGRGMLFVFPDTQVRSFWMSNTFIPLDIAYLDAELRVVDIQAMEPQTEESHASAAPAMFALEVPQGWFADQGIGVGSQARVIFGPD